MKCILWFIICGTMIKIIVDSRAIHSVSRKHIYVSDKKEKKCLLCIHNYRKVEGYILKDYQVLLFELIYYEEHLEQYELC